METCSYIATPQQRRMTPDVSPFTSSDTLAVRVQVPTAQHAQPSAATVPTLLFLPHCESDLTTAVMRANASALRSVAVLGAQQSSPVARLHPVMRLSVRQQTLSPIGRHGL